MKVGSITYRSRARINGFQQNLISPWEIDEYLSFERKQYLGKTSSQTLLKPPPQFHLPQPKKVSLRTHRPHLLRLKTLELPLSENKKVHFRKNSNNALNNYKAKNDHIYERQGIDIQSKKFKIQRKYGDSKYAIRQNQRFKTVELEEKNTLMFFMESRNKNNVMKREKNIMKIRNIGNKKQRSKKSFQPQENIQPTQR